MGLVIEQVIRTPFFLLQDSLPVIGEQQTQLPFTRGERRHFDLR